MGLGRLWQPPSEEEFNGWLKPHEALKEPLGKIEGNSERRSLLEQLKGGVTIGIARTAQLSSNPHMPPAIFVPVNRAAWDKLSLDDIHHFWKTGQVIAETRGYDDERTERYFDVRLMPSGALLADALPTPDIPTDEANPERATDLSKAEAQRFCRAILAGWTEVTQDWAHEKALLFFPDRKVPRDWFRSILRSIRGSEKPGPKGKRRDERETLG